MLECPGGNNDCGNLIEKFDVEIDTHLQGEEDDYIGINLHLKNMQIDFELNFDTGVNLCFWMCLFEGVCDFEPVSIYLDHLTLLMKMPLHEQICESTDDVYPNEEACINSGCEDCLSNVTVSTSVGEISWDYSTTLASWITWLIDSCDDEGSPTFCTDLLLAFGDLGPTMGDIKNKIQGMAADMIVETAQPLLQSFFTENVHLLTKFIDETAPDMGVSPEWWDESIGSGMKDHVYKKHISHGESIDSRIPDGYYGGDNLYEYQKEIESSYGQSDFFRKSQLWDNLNAIQKHYYGNFYEVPLHRGKQSKEFYSETLECDIPPDDLSLFSPRLRRLANNLNMMLDNIIVNIGSIEGQGCWLLYMLTGGDEAQFGNNLGTGGTGDCTNELGGVSPTCSNLSLLFNTNTEFTLSSRVQTMRVGQLLGWALSTLCYHDTFQPLCVIDVCVGGENHGETCTDVENDCPPLPDKWNMSCGDDWTCPDKITPCGDGSNPEASCGPGVTECLNCWYTGWPLISECDDGECDNGGAWHPKKGQDCDPNSLYDDWYYIDDSWSTIQVNADCNERMHSNFDLSCSTTFETIQAAFENIPVLVGQMDTVQDDGELSAGTPADDYCIDHLSDGYPENEWFDGAVCGFYNDCYCGTSCENYPGGDVYGCMDEDACNYNEDATIDDEMTCTYASDYPHLCFEDTNGDDLYESRVLLYWCLYENITCETAEGDYVSEMSQGIIFGCTDFRACNYNPSANTNSDCDYGSKLSGLPGEQFDYGFQDGYNCEDMNVINDFIFENNTYCAQWENQGCWEDDCVCNQWEDLTFNAMVNEGMVIFENGDLVEIDMQKKGLKGRLPETIGHAKNLRVLNVHTNGKNWNQPNNQGFGGEIPSSIGNLTRLEIFNGGGNGWSGEIPTSIAPTLDAHGNSVGGLLRLKHLDLQGNLCPDPWIGDCTGNRLEGDIPSRIGDLSNLVHLGLQRNELTGEIPSSIGNLRNLNFLELGNNRLSGFIPESLCNIFDMYLNEQMATFYIGWNNLCEPYPDCFYTLTLPIEPLIRNQDCVLGSNL